MPERLTRTTLVPGTVLDGANRGWRATGHLVEYAAALGMPLNNTDKRFLAAFLAADEHQRCVECAMPIARVDATAECDGCDQDPWRSPVHYGTCPLRVVHLPEHEPTLADLPAAHSHARHEHSQGIAAFEVVPGRGELADDALEWLNEHIAPEDGSFAFGWHEGSLMLWSTEDWEVESW